MTTFVSRVLAGLHRFMPPLGWAFAASALPGTLVGAVFVGILGHADAVQQG